MNRTCFYSCVLIILIASFNASFSLEGDSGVRAPKEKTTPSSSREIIVKDTKEQPGVVSILDEKDVKNSPETNLVDLLNQHVPSFHTGNNRVMGFGVAGSGASKMSIRGIGISGWGPTTGMPMLINGLDTTTSIMGHPVADIFTMKNIDRVEVLHGPQPVLYGSGAMGGIVNIITKRQETDGFYSELSGSYGSWNTTDSYALHQGKMGMFDYGISYNFQYTAGHRSQPTPNGNEATSEYLNQNVNARFGFQLGDHWYAGVNGYVMKMRIGDPGSAYAAGTAALNALETFYILRDGCSINVMNRYDKFEGTIHLYMNHGQHDAYQEDNNDFHSYEQEDLLYGAKITETAKLLPGNRITLGVEIKSWGGTAKNPDNSTNLALLARDNYYVKDKYLTDTSVFALAEQRVLDYALLSAGVRYTHDSKFGSHVSWQAGIALYPLADLFDVDTADVRLHCAAAAGFRLPDLRQLYLYGPFPAWNPNPDLEPETVFSIEYGTELALLEKVTMSVTGYRVYNDDRFVTTGTGMNTTWANDSDRFVYDGVEASMRAKIIETAGLRGGYSFIDNEYHNEYLVYVPRHRFVAGVFFEGYNAYAGIDCEWVRDIYADAAGTQELSNFLVLNARISYLFLEHFKVFVNFNNITDRAYRTFWGYPMPGFHVLGGLTAMY